MSRFAALLLTVGCLALTLILTHGAAPPAANRPRVDALGDPLPPAAVARLGSLQFYPGAHITHLVFSPDDKVLYSLGLASPLRTWDTATGKERGDAVALAETPLLAAAFASDGKWLAFAVGRNLDIRDLEQGKTVRRFVLGEHGCKCIAWRADSQVIAWADTKGTITLIDLVGNGKPLVFRDPDFHAAWLSIAPEGKMLATMPGDGYRVVLWDVPKGRRVRSYSGEEKNDLRGFGFDRTGKLLVCGSNRGKIYAWEADSIDEKYHLEMKGSTRAIALSPDGKVLAGIGSSGTITLWEASTGKLVQVVEDHNEVLECLAISRDGKMLATGGEWNAIQVWDLPAGKRKRPKGSEDFAEVAFGKDSRAMVSVGPGQISHWSAEGRPVRRVPVAEELNAKRLLPGGEMGLFEAGANRTQLRSLETGELRTEIEVAWKGNIGVDPTGRYLAVPGQNEVELWSFRTGKKERQIALEGIDSCQFSPDGRTLHVLGRSKTNDPHRMRLEVASGAWRAPMQTPNPVDSRDTFVWSPDGRIFATGEDSYSIQVCDADRSRLLHTLFGNDKFRCICYSPNGRWIAAGGDDCCVWIWDVATGRMRACLPGHRGKIESVQFAPDSKRLLSRSDDGTALVWDVAEALRLEQPREQPPQPRALETLWADLAGDALVAESAIRELARRPDDAVAWFSKHVEPVPAVEPARLNRLIAQLDAENAADRDEAMRQLTALDDLARSRVEAALKSPSVEVRRRAATVLKRIDTPTRGNLELRPLRAVEALEAMNTPAARKLLLHLSRGAADARLTQDAAAALKRLEARQ